MSEEDDQIPVVEIYRGVGIHDRQPQRRIENTVKPAIDGVFKLEDPADLVAYLKNSAHPPEARLFAAARIKALWELAADARTSRPLVDLRFVRACVAGLDSRRWRHRRRYTTALDPYDHDAAEREQPLDD